MAGLETNEILKERLSRKEGIHQLSQEEIEKIKEKNPKGIIFTGGPASVYAENAPKCSEEIFNLGIPVLGICYGMQLMTHMLGGKVQKADKREYGVTNVKINNKIKALNLYFF